jgi:nucleotide-binding universal stress UspA family protein
MTTTIIIPINLANGEHNVLKYGAALAKRLGARVLLLHPYLQPRSTYYGVGADGFTTYLPEDDVAEDIAVRKAEMKELVSEVPGLLEVSCDWSIQEGPVSDVVAQKVEKVTEEGQRPLVIMGTFEPTGVSELFGTIAEKVTRQCSCPVLVIPGTQEFKLIKRVCLALDEESSTREADYPLLIDIINAYKARLLGIHVHEKDEGIGQAHHAILRQLEKHVGSDVTSRSLHTVMAENIESSIDSFCHQHDIDLLVLVYREHGFIKRLFNPGVRTKMVYHTETPILVLK